MVQYDIFCLIVLSDM